MKLSIVSLRISRRAIAAASIDDEVVTLQDCRHLSSKADRAAAALQRYVVRILDVTGANTVVVDAPHKVGSTTNRLLHAARGALADRHVAAQVVPIADVLASFGLPGLRSRTELMRVVDQFWPELAAVKREVRAHVLSAAAMAFYADVQQALGGVPTA